MYFLYIFSSFLNHCFLKDICSSYLTQQIMYLHLLFVEHSLRSIESEYLIFFFHSFKLEIVLLYIIFSMYNERIYFFLYFYQNHKNHENHNKYDSFDILSYRLLPSFHKIFIYFSFLTAFFHLYK